MPRWAAGENRRAGRSWRQGIAGRLASLLLLACAGCGGGADPEAAREAARRHVSVGVAYMAQFLPGKAMEEFQAALERDPDNLAATVNMGIASRVAADLPAARRWLRKALELDPDQIAAHYNLALVERLEGNPEAAIAHLDRVVALDPRDAEAHYNLGLAYAQLRREERALEALDAALARNPRHVSALYARGRALLALGREEEAMAALEASQALSGGQLATTAGQQYGEQGIHSLAMEDLPADPSAGPALPVRFAVVEGTLSFIHAGGPGGGAEAPAGSGVAILDADGDGHLDLFLANAGRAGDVADALHRNNGDGTFEDISSLALPAAPGASTGVTAGDYDNDGHMDLYVGRRGPNRLLRNRGNGTFEDVAPAAGADHAGGAMAVAFADADHDGDLDLLVAGDGPEGGVAFLRNRGDGTFEPATEQVGLVTRGPATGLLLVDLDLDRDVDLVVTGPGGVGLFLNNRDGTFAAAPGGWAPQVAGARRGVVALDLHKDGFLDLVFSGDGPGPGVSLWRNTGQGLEARAADGLAAALPPAYGLVVLDYDLDGFADLAAAGGEGSGWGVKLFRNQGRGVLEEVTAEVGLDTVPPGPGRTLVAADLDGDGDPDLVLGRAGESALVLRNDGGSAHSWVKVGLDGLHSNRAGIGARVALRAGALWEQTYVTASGGYLGSTGGAPLTFGLGRHAPLDAISVLWPGGVLQDEIQVAAGTLVPVKELDRKGSSCPSLFGWDGTQFVYLGDFLSGGGLGLALAPGVIYTPDPEELHLVRPALGLAPDRRGRMALRLAENLEEVTYLDRIHLRAVDHPAGTVVLPVEGLRPGPPHPPPTLHLMDALMPPARAMDGEGRDWTAAVAEVDGVTPTFPLLRSRGFAAGHVLILTFPAPPAGSGPVWLYAHGTLEFANSTPNIAAAQHGGGLRWPALERLEPDGSWTTLEPALPLPMGVDKPVLVPLEGRLAPGAEVTLRIATNMEVYWDRVALAAERAGGVAAAQVHDLPAERAELRALGYPLWSSREGRMPWTFHYDRRQPFDTWKRIPGRYTRFGDVGDLVREADDRLVVMAPGDEIALEFDARALPALPGGWTRTWLVYGVGYVKDMDLHSPGSGRVEPLPFRAMSAYPPPPGEAPPRALLEAAAARNGRVVVDSDPLRRHPSGSAVAAP